jgi:hypothetical protein
VALNTYTGIVDSKGNAAQGHLYLECTDVQINTQTRYYNRLGQRMDESGDTLGGEGAIVPTWETQTRTLEQTYFNRPAANDAVYRLQA